MQTSQRRYEKNSVYRAFALILFSTPALCQVSAHVLEPGRITLGGGASIRSFSTETGIQTRTLPIGVIDLNFAGFNSAPINQGTQNLRYLVFAQLRSTLVPVIGTGETVPYLYVDFTPIGLGHGDRTRFENSVIYGPNQRINVDFMPVVFNRNLSTNNPFSFAAYAAGLSYRIINGSGWTNGLVDLSVRALGYRVQELAATNTTQGSLSSQLGLFSGSIRIGGSLGDPSCHTTASAPRVSMFVGGQLESGVNASRLDTLASAYAQLTGRIYYVDFGVTTRVNMSWIQGTTSIPETQIIGTVGTGY